MLCEKTRANMGGGRGGYGGFNNLKCLISFSKTRIFENSV